HSGIKASSSGPGGWSIEQIIALLAPVLRDQQRADTLSHRAHGDLRGRCLHTTSTGESRPGAPGGFESHRPPLASQLFEARFADVVSRYPACRGLIPRLRDSV